MVDRPERVDYRFEPDDDGHPMSGKTWAHTKHTYNDGGEVVEIQVSARGDTWKQARKRVDSKMADIREAVADDSPGGGCPNCGRPATAGDVDFPVCWSGEEFDATLCPSCKTVYRKEGDG